jgi:hypothetical protein
LVFPEVVAQRSRNASKKGGGDVGAIAGAALAFGVLMGVTQVGFAEDALANADSNGWPM